MKRFLVFSGDTYYPCGGWDDFKGDFESLEEAKEFALRMLKEEHEDWTHVVDTRDRIVHVYLPNKEQWKVYSFTEFSETVFWT